jgi:hypothetical protein
MRNPHLLRRVAFGIAAAVAIAVLVAFDGWLSIAAPLAVLMLGVIVGQTLFQHFASRAEIIADLEGLPPGA